MVIRIAGLAVAWIEMSRLWQLGIALPSGQIMRWDAGTGYWLDHLGAEIDDVNVTRIYCISRRKALY
jgi:hypothetical protein